MLERKGASARWLALSMLLATACASAPSVRTEDAGPVAGGGGGASGRPARSAHEVYQGRASYYARRFAGRKTASGERYDPARFTAAHADLPLGTKIRVTRVPEGTSVIVKVNDRCGCTHGRIVDLSEAAARKLGMMQAGVVAVKLEVLGR